MLTSSGSSLMDTQRVARAHHVGRPELQRIEIEAPRELVEGAVDRESRTGTARSRDRPRPGTVLV